MKIGYFSDTHFEFQNRNVSKFLDSIVVDGLDCLLLAGDISTLDRNSYSRFIVNKDDVIDMCKIKFKCPVFAVNGNHEFYGLDMVDYSPDDRFMVNMYNKYAVIGATLWTDYCLMGKESQHLAMLECNKLSDSKRIFYNGEPFTSDKALSLHYKDRQFILNALEKSKSHNLRPIILTHHVPHSVARNANYPLDFISAGFYSDCVDLIEAAEDANCAAWIFGHHHYCVEDFSSLNFPLLSAQVGYIGEKTGWKGVGVLEL